MHASMPYRSDLRAQNRSGSNNTKICGGELLSGATGGGRRNHEHLDWCNFYLSIDTPSLRASGIHISFCRP